MTISDNVQSLHGEVTKWRHRIQAHPETAFVRDVFEKALGRIVQCAAESAGARFEFQFARGYPALVNSETEKQFAVAAAEKIVGTQAVEANMQPIMGAEDFAFMLRKVPGCYVFLGNGTGSGSAPCSLHNPHYDFNDAIIPIGIQYWVNLAESYLSPRS